MTRYRQAGVDQVSFVLQAGRNRHDDICESIELFAREVLPRFAEPRPLRPGLEEAAVRALARRAPPRPARAGYMITPQGEPFTVRGAQRASPGFLLRLSRFLGAAWLERLLAIRE